MPALYTDNDKSLRVKIEEKTPETPLEKKIASFFTKTSNYQTVLDQLFQTLRGEMEVNPSYNHNGTTVVRFQVGKEVCYFQNMHTRGYVLVK